MGKLQIFAKLVFFVGKSRSKVVSGRERFILAYPLVLEAHTGKNTVVLLKRLYIVDRS